MVKSYDNSILIFLNQTKYFRKIQFEFVDALVFRTVSQNQDEHQMNSLDLFHYNYFKKFSKVPLQKNKQTNKLQTEKSKHTIYNRIA